MLMSKKQAKAMELLSSMEMIAQEKDMKLWIFDRIRELKACLKKNLSEMEMDFKILEIDEIAEYIQKQISSDTVEECIVDDLTTVSLEEVKYNIRNVMEESVEKNKYLVGSYVKAQQTYIEEAERNMKEIGNAEALYNQIQNSGIFCNFFGQIGKKLDMQIGNSAKQFVETAFRNCDGAINKIKNIFFSMQNESLHKNKKELYHKYDAQSNLLKQEMENRVTSMTYGGEVIEEFGKKHSERIEKILKRNKRKRKFYKLLPVLVVLTLWFAPRAINKLIDIITDTKKVDQANTESGIDFLKKLIDIVEDLMKNGGSILVVIVVAGIFIALFYWVYLHKVEEWYKQWVASEASAYLMPALERFWQETELIEKVEESFVEISTELKNNYYELLDGILNDRTVEEVVIVDSREMEFQQIYREWNIVKKSV